MAGRLSLLLLLAAVLFLATEAGRIEQDAGVSALVSHFRQGRAATTVTATLITTTTISSVTTTVTTTKKICWSLVTAAGATPSTTCRRRRSADAPFMYLLYGENGVELNNQFDYIQPSKVLRLEPTALPLDRKSEFPSFEASVIQASFEKTPDNTRVAQPVYFNLLSSIVSSIVNSILTTTTTSTSTVTAYTSTSSSTSYSTTIAVTLSGTCYPAGITTC